MLVDPHRTFESLLVSVPNRIAFRAVKRAIGDASTRPNPLLVIGPPASGKTHLLHAAANTLLARKQPRSVRLLTAETFTNRFLGDIREGRMPAFRAHMRRSSVLLVDALEDTEDRPATMDELGATVRAVIERRGTVILTLGETTRGHVRELTRHMESYERGLVVRWHAAPMAIRISAMQRVLRSRRRRLPIPRLVELARCASSVPEATAAVQRELLAA